MGFIASVWVALAPVAVLAYHDLTSSVPSLLSPLGLAVDGLVGVFAVAGSWGAWNLRGVAPDAATVDSDGIRLLHGETVLHTLGWNDPRFQLILIDLSGDGRANSLPRLALWSYKLSMSREFWPMTPEFMAAALEGARANGLTVSQTDARRFHFPDGDIYTLGPRRSQAG